MHTDSDWAWVYQGFPPVNDVSITSLWGAGLKPCPLGCGALCGCGLVCVDGVNSCYCWWWFLAVVRSVLMGIPVVTVGGGFWLWFGLC